MKLWLVVCLLSLGYLDFVSTSFCALEDCDNPGVVADLSSEENPVNNELNFFQVNLQLGEEPEHYCKLTGSN